MDIEVEINGKTYIGRYEVRGNLLTVNSAYGSKSTQPSRGNNEFMAKTLLRELIREYGEE